MSTWNVGPLDVWPDVESLVVSWLHTHCPDVNVRTETNPTFGTDSPDASMTCPLVLVSAVTSGSYNAAELASSTMLIDVACFGQNTPGMVNGRANMWALHHRVNAWMLRALGQSTALGTFDDVYVHDFLGVVQYSNPNVRRTICTYAVTARPFATLTT